MKLAQIIGSDVQYETAKARLGLNVQRAYLVARLEELIERIKGGRNGPHPY